MNKKLIIALFMVLFIIPYHVSAEQEQVILNRCVDGDTARFIIDGKAYSTRFLAIDTPETKHPKKGVEPYGKEASNYTCNKLKNAKKIVLEYDDGSTKEDKYGRRLAWIFVDDQLLQKQIIKKGYAKVAYLYGDYKYTEILQNTEKQAKRRKVGIWSDEKKSLSEKGSISLDEILKKLYRYVRKELKSML